MRRLTLKFIHHFQSPKFLHAFHHHLLYSTSSSSTTTHSFANYLVDSLGFSHQQALSASNKLSKYRKANNFNFEANANSVVTFFKSYGFNDVHLRKMVNFDPRLLCCNVDNTLEPKLIFFKDEGFSESDLIRFISVNPTLLLSRSESSILSAVEILRKFLVCDANVIAVLGNLRRHPFSGIIRYLLPNIELLSSYGIPVDTIRRHLVQQPRTFLPNPEKFKEIVIRVEKQFSEETIESKCRMFKSFGWTQSDVDTFMIKNAHCFTRSAESIKKKLDFFMIELGLKPAYLTSRCSFFTYSLEKRIVPRHKVLLVLKEKGLLKKNPSLHTAISMPESRFLNMFVRPFKEVHEVYAKHIGCSMKMLTEERANNLQ